MDPEKMDTVMKMAIASCHSLAAVGTHTHTHTHTHSLTHTHTQQTLHVLVCVYFI